MRKCQAFGIHSAASQFDIVDVPVWHHLAHFAGPPKAWTIPLTERMIDLLIAASLFIGNELVKGHLSKSVAFKAAAEAERDQ